MNITISSSLSKYAFEQKGGPAEQQWTVRAHILLPFYVQCGPTLCNAHTVYVHVSCHIFSCWCTKVCPH